MEDANRWSSLIPSLNCMMGPMLDRGHIRPMCRIRPARPRPESGLQFSLGGVNHLKDNLRTLVR